MSKLCISLPPFAPDYSGAASALFEMGGLIVIHDASGCTGNYTGFDEPRWFGSESAVYCSGLRHMDAVLGSDEKLVERVARAAESLSPKFIAVLGSPVPMIVGTDFKGIAVEIEEKTGIPTIGLNTTGLSYYGKGISAAIVSVLKKFAPKEINEKNPKGINLLGVTPLDFSGNDNHKEFAKLFENNGIEVIAQFCQGMTPEKVKEATKASLNVAVSQSGIAVGEYMKSVYNIPYIVGTPIGDGNIIIKKTLRELESIQNSEKRILIVGEQIIAASLRDYMEAKSNATIDIAVIFDATEELLRKNDLVIKNELHLRKLLNSGKYKKVIADPLIKQLAEGTNIDFFALPHVAVSSKVHWDESILLLGEKMEEFLKQIS